MHPNNLHNKAYNLELLCKTHPSLKEFVFVNKYENSTIDFSDQKAVFHLNKALLKHYYKITDWNIPEGYLCPPIPSRSDYIHYIADLIKSSDISDNIKGLDIGVGANCIYPILGSRLYHWEMTGVDISETSVIAAKKNIKSTKGLSDKINIIHQTDNANIFKSIIQEHEYYHFTMCNPPFYESEEKAQKANAQKSNNLGKTTNLNFGGQANELWCNGGEALFIKRMIKQSAAYKMQVNWFTCLVSKAANLPKIYKQLNKLKATHQTINMEHGNKTTRFVAWQWA